MSDEYNNDWYQENETSNYNEVLGEIITLKLK